MQTLYFSVNNIDDVLVLYNQIQVIKYIGDLDEPETPVGNIDDLSDWEIVTGVYPYSAPINLIHGVTEYYIYDDSSNSLDWYASRYIHSTDPENQNSGWSSPTLSTTRGIYYNPMYPPEMVLSNDDKLLVERLRVLIGDNINIKRDINLDSIENLHADGYVYELSEKGWPASIKVCETQYTSISNPVVNGYKYLKFNSKIDLSDCSQEYVIDIWYYTFRYSDKELIDAYDRTPPPFGLTAQTATSDAYILSAAIDLLRSELFMDATESGAKITDDLTTYDPSPGLDNRRMLLKSLEDQLDKIVTSLKLHGISGVRVD
jgi:hypothetical protein